MPTVKLEVVKLALPPESVTLPRVFVPSLNVTVPVGVPIKEKVGATVVVKVTGWPDLEGFWELVVVGKLPPVLRKTERKLSPPLSTRSEA